MLNSIKNSGEMLFYEAKRYKTHGWSVIPLLGGTNLHDLKRPAIKWGRYQHTHPQEADLESWFLESGFGGLGIVCGRISSLAVLDFDDPNKASEFRRLHLQLTQTRTISSGTRHLPHYYYHIPDEISVHSRSVAGADFRADGAYVVAPPTGQGDVHWRLINDVPLLTLSTSDLKAIWRFLASPVPENPENGSGGLSQPNSSHSIYLLSSHPGKPDTSDQGRRNHSDASVNDLLALYKGQLGQGRNNALFWVACIARDRGVGMPQVVQTLATIHALQPASDGLNEPFQTRYAEALRTIDSVFQRSPRQTLKDHEGVGIPTPSGSQPLSALLNSIREWLLGHACAAAARVLDGLLMAGIKAETIFTERQACEWLQPFRIGRRSIMTALKSLLPDGKPLFEKVTEPLHTSPIVANAATQSEIALKKCDLVTGANRVKTSGRPAVYYRLPDNDKLMQRFGLSHSQADPLSVDDLASPKTYRRALHGALVNRRPGSYTRGWLAERLGVSKWTSRRYDAALNIIVQPLYTEQPVRWTNVESLVPRSIEDARPGTFMETEDGKRYPPLRAIAMHLLDMGRKLVHKTRIANYYSPSNPEGVGIPTPSQTPVSLHFTLERNDSCSHWAFPNENTSVKPDLSTQQNKMTTQQGVGIPTPSFSHASPSFWLCPDCLRTHIAIDAPETCERCGSCDWERVPDLIWRDQERLKSYWQSRWREKHPSAPHRATPLVENRRRRNSDAFPNRVSKSDPEIEHTAQQAHECVPDLSRINALHLVKQYGVHAVEGAIARLQHRGGIRSPAGFLISLLKSEHLFYSRKTLKSQKRPHEDASEWVRQMTESAYVEFLSNADEFIDLDKLK
ncbi:MAG: bifunctional DNA primase/polymerase [Chloroflexota bacterium]